MRSGVVSARSASVRRRAVRAGQPFRHYNFRAARFRFDHVEFVHERTHQKNPAARSAQKILFRQRARNHSKLLNSRSVVWVTYRARPRQWRARIEPSWARATYRDLQPHPTITPNSRQIAQNLVFTLPRTRLRRYRTSATLFSE